MKEEWRNIIGYENYEVSNTGKVKSKNYNNTGLPKELKPKINKQGYLEISLSKNNKAKYFMLNRLVIEAFTNFKLNKNIIILYKDKNPLNCSLDNLFYTTRGKYQEFTYDKGKRKVLTMEYEGKKINIKQISKITGICRKTIASRIKNGWNSYEVLEVPKGR